MDGLVIPQVYWEVCCICITNLKIYRLKHVGRQKKNDPRIYFILKSVSTYFSSLYDSKMSDKLAFLQYLQYSAFKPN